ncbi:FMN-dependent NADH-azoreductase 2 [Clostridium homopropionicum DSM 5847]|uniref:FMN dependent NADH:quinone oxidoreductase n=1 Tax=Clostridium homopropionicum DSM 5847 TaxID=1121318 RepID=A0A0L6ZAN1_9CLOT|nr:NAD(P)H-dependent oxidoreductase [Clostridium homopropionicum]KOA19843.1 FMN-dependent NADH-azoreductase 2 [Clostridium homopropionicum DSM 5847]SFF76242.1 FMN-dependent NADH-azoreductase [Clostridium homopropionicum]
MKKLLYITVNPKPEQMSTSKTVGRQFVNRFLEEDKEYVMEELDLYKEDIPEVNHILFSGRAETVSGDAYNALSEQDKKQVDRINALCDQFIAADTYVIAAPMWSVSFPSRLKRYFDCIILNNKVIKISPEDVQGLLDDKERSMVYIQSSGGVYPKIFNSKINHGVEYVEDIFKFLGIRKFKKILVEGVDIPSVGREAAISNAFADVDAVVDALTTDKLIQI